MEENLSVDGLIAFASNEGARSYFYALGITDLLPDWNSAFSKTRNTLVLTGTCLGQGLDEIAIEQAAKLGWPSVAVIDHWSWYRRRFEVGDDSGSGVLSD